MTSEHVPQLACKYEHNDLQEVKQQNEGHQVSMQQNTLHVMALLNVGNCVQNISLVF